MSTALFVSFFLFFQSVQSLPPPFGPTHLPRDRPPFVFFVDRPFFCLPPCGYNHCIYQLWLPLSSFVYFRALVFPVYQPRAFSTLDISFPFLFFVRDCSSRSVSHVSASIPSSLIFVVCLCRTCALELCPHTAAGCCESPISYSFFLTVPDAYDSRVFFAFLLFMLFLRASFSSLSLSLAIDSFSLFTPCTSLGGARVSCLFFERAPAPSCYPCLFHFPL